MSHIREVTHRFTGNWKVIDKKLILAAFQNKIHFFQLVSLAANRLQWENGLKLWKDITNLPITYNSKRDLLSMWKN